MTFFLGHKVGAPSPEWEGSEEFPELLFQMGLLYLRAQETIVSEEILYNVSVGKVTQSASRSGVFTHCQPQMTSFIINYRQRLSQKQLSGREDCSFKSFGGTFRINLSENTNQWVQLRKKKLMADKQLKRELFGYLASFTTSLCLKLLASHTCKHLRFFFFCIILLACLEILVETDYFQTHKD